MEWVILTLILALQIWSIDLYYKWESYNKKKGENLAMKEDSCDINYEGEKGKNLATKEDIADITRRIESVKDSYNKALESHKIELQKEFESHKYIMNLCFSMDKEIIQRLMAFQKANSQYIIDPSDEAELIQSIQYLYESLSAYKFRYFHIPIFQQLYQNVYKICDKEFNNQKYYECSGTMKLSFTQEDIRILYINSTKILKMMMPTLQLKDNIKPEA